MAKSPNYQCLPLLTVLPLNYFMIPGHIVVKYITYFLGVYEKISQLIVRKGAQDAAQKF
jgi:hypothetical protein